MRLHYLALVVIAAAACTAKSEKAADTAAVAPDTGLRLIVSTTGFSTPESVRYDEMQDLYFVSNINGNPSAKDGNGYISRMKADGNVDSVQFITGGRDGVTLNAPKGMAIIAETLWVADIDAARAFNTRTGAPIATVEMRRMGATFLNDVVIGPDGSVYITDTGIRFDSRGRMTHPGKDRVYRITGRTAKVVVDAGPIGGPNGIAWDRSKDRFMIAPFDAQALYWWKLGDIQPTALVTGPGGYDGLEILADGRILASSWADSAIHVFSGDSRKVLIPGKPAPADFGIDTKRNRIAIPLFNDGAVEIWALQ
jgi:sugar lactone lactonase YvrE